MNHEFQPVERYAELRFLTVDLRSLLDWFETAFKRSSDFFSTAADTVIWVATYRMGSKQTEGGIEELSKLRAEALEELQHLELRFYKALYTQNIRLHLLPTEHIIIF